MSKITWLVILVVLFIISVIFFVSFRGNNPSNNAGTNQDDSNNVVVPSLDSADDSEFTNIQTSDDDFKEIDAALDVLE